MKILLSFFDYTGNWCHEYKNDPEWIVCQFDIKHGKDILDFEPGQFMREYFHKDHCHLPKVFLLFAIPCTDYALSGAKHFKAKDLDGRTAASQVLVAKVKSIIDWFTEAETLIGWSLENPMSRIHKLNPWLGDPVLKFNPCDYSGYDPVPENSRYNKRTWLWGRFNIPEPKRLEPLQKENPGWKK